MEHGTRSTYVGGCRCDECKVAESNYQRDRRRSKRKLGSVPTLPNRPDANDSPDAVGLVEGAVQAEIDTLSTAAKRPGLVAAALAMARLLDGPLYVAQHPQAAARLQGLLAELRIGADTKKGWLAAVRDMNPPTTGAG
jgi:hypothetical protein